MLEHEVTLIKSALPCGRGRWLLLVVISQCLRGYFLFWPDMTKAIKVPKDTISVKAALTSIATPPFK